MVERIRFRRWWQPPRPAGNRPEERRVTFLELFYDLVYVVIVAELSHALAENISLTGIAIFIFLFIIVCGHGSTVRCIMTFTGIMIFEPAFHLFTDAHCRRDGCLCPQCDRRRLGGLCTCLCRFSFDLPGYGGGQASMIRIIVPFLSLIPLTFLITSVLFIFSIFIPVPWRFILWVLALSIDLALLSLLTTNRNTAIQEQINRIVLISPSAVERFGVFTIIVLGEVIVGVVSGVAEQPSRAGGRCLRLFGYDDRHRTLVDLL